ncbi:DUF7144 family membrane protein [Nocardia grenadensis]|uniref:DUF7144 family membrane protein n=1 Tax=Nocardia grenadensis TaxID=931537 RepID=UPI0007A3C564|nr:hypothetical protein [Nocardia grenadensis]
MTTDPAAPTPGRPGTTGAHAASTEDNSAKQAIATGTSIAAAALLLVAGFITLFQGISAAANDDVFVAGPNYVYELDLTSWGWIHIVFGILLILAGLALLTGALWARIVAIGLAALSIIVNFLWIPWYPLWSILIIAIDIVIIWAIATWRPERA